MLIRLIILAIPVLLCCITAWAAEPVADDPPLPPEYTYVDHEGYRYSYKTTADVGGTLEVKAPKKNQVVFKESQLNPGGCPGTRFAKPRALQHSPDSKMEIVALCGEDEGHYPTLMLFERGQMVARLDYVITEPNLVWHPEFQSYLAEIVIREGMNIKGIAYLPMVYEWTPGSDNDDNGFHPVFNSHSYKLYLRDYQLFKKENDDSEVGYLLMIAALVSTSKATLICSELASSPLNTLKQTQINKYLAIIERNGYPSFDLSICKARKVK